VQRYADGIPEKCAGTILEERVVLGRWRGGHQGGAAAAAIAATYQSPPRSANSCSQQRLTSNYL